MGQKFNLKINKNKSNGQCNISLPAKKLKDFDMKNMKRVKITIEGFE